MELIEFVTPSGYKVFLKPYLNFGQKRELERFMASFMSADPGKKESNTKIVGSAIIDSQDMVCKYLIDHVIVGEITKSGSEAFDEINSWKEEDGKAVYTKVDEITSSKEISEDTKKN